MSTQGFPRFSEHALNPPLSCRTPGESLRIARRPAPRYSCGMFRSVSLIALAFCAMAPAADSPQWRGPNRDGKSAETGLLGQWPAGGPRLAWKAQGLGEGYSS